MKNILRCALLAVLFLSASAFAMHKFYVAIYQLHFNQDKKSLEITSRIFLDDLNKALERKYHHPMRLGDKEETAEDVNLMKKYIAENFEIKINGKPKTFSYLSKEIENNVLICYFKIVDVPTVSTLEVEDTILLDLVTQQQNIIQTTIYGKKNSLLLTSDEPSGKITF